MSWDMRELGYVFWAYRSMKHNGRSPAPEVIWWATVAAFSNYALWLREYLGHSEDWEAAA